MAQGFKSDIPPAINQTAKKYIRGMMKGRRRWTELYGVRDKEVMHKTANKMATKEQVKMGPTYKELLDPIEIKPGESFTFRVTELGLWNYEETISKDYGEIEVKDPKNVPEPVKSETLEEQTPETETPDIEELETLESESNPQLL